MGGRPTGGSIVFVFYLMIHSFSRRLPKDSRTRIRQFRRGLGTCRHVYTVLPHMDSHRNIRSQWGGEGGLNFYFLLLRTFKLIMTYMTFSFHASFYSDFLELFFFSFRSIPASLAILPLEFALYFPSPSLRGIPPAHSDAQ